MVAYYNEFDPFAAAWLRNLIAEGLIAEGHVDERSITEVRPDDLRGYDQCHFFAGIGGWSLALRLAEWPDNRPVWTGSCPCQPFSIAGRRQGKQDERHLWPVWFNLIKKCRPSTIFGEQVAAAITHGWFDEAAYDLEKENYRTAAANLPAFSVEAAHERMRLFFVSDTHSVGLQRGECRLSQNTRTGNIDAKVFPTLSFLKHRKLNDIPAPILCVSNDGVSNRVGKLRGYGNAIVPQVAAEFIKAYSWVRGFDLA